jgi:hypothetical protein
METRGRKKGRMVSVSPSCLWISVGLAFAYEINEDLGLGFNGLAVE